MTIHVSEEEWKVAVNFAYEQGRHSKSESNPALFIAAAGTLETSSHGAVSIGAPMLTHSFIQLRGELYAIGNEEEGALLGEGAAGKVFQAINYQGQQVAVKIPKEQESIEQIEEEVLTEMGYLHGMVEHENTQILIMALLQGHDLFKLHKKSSLANPWQQAAKNAGFTESEQQAFNQGVVATGGKAKRALATPELRDIIREKIMSSLAEQPDKERLAENCLVLIENEYQKLNPAPLYDEAQRLAFVLEAAKALKAFFDKGYLHRDIKGSNFIGQVEEGKVTVNLVDFGTVLRLESAEAVVKERLDVGTLDYEAPEVLSGMHMLQRKYYQQQLGIDFSQYKIAKGKKANFSQKSDIYSFARMCELDFGFDLSSLGFGLLEKAESMAPEDRPNLESIIFSLECQHTICFGADNEKQALLESLQRNQFPENFDHRNQSDFLQKLVQSAYQTLEHSFKEAYKASSAQTSKAVKNTFNHADLTSITQQVEGTRTSNDVTCARAVLQEKGWLDQSHKRAGPLKVLLELQEELSSQNPIIKGETFRL